MSGLTIIVISTDHGRLRAALAMALAQAALDGRVTLYFHEASVALLTELPPAQDAVPQGLPDTAAMIDMAREAGIRFVVCQTGLALAEIDIASLSGCEAGGLVGLLAGLGTDRLITV